jgi:DNA-binding MarR family transcriptional regulator
MSAQHLKLFLDLNRAHAMISRRFDAELGSVHGIGLNDLQLLQALADAPERRLRRIDLAQQLGVTASGVTWMLRPLIKRRLVQSEASAEDARVAFAVLTEGGRRLVAEALPSARKLAAALLEATLPKPELARAAELMARLAPTV